MSGAEKFGLVLILIALPILRDEELATLGAILLGVGWLFFLLGGDMTKR